MRAVIATACAGALLILHLACGGTAVFAQQAGYTVGPQDVLSVAVFDGAELSGKYTVENDGSFALPLVGRIKAGGRTLREIEQEITKQLAVGFFRNPQVSVSVEQYRSQRIFVVGEVRQAGAYPLTGDMTLIEALSRAGSTTPGASGEAIIVRAPAGRAPASAVLPTQAEGVEIIRVDLDQLEQGNVSQNVLLHDGDTIFVGRARTIYVYGQVKNPGAYALQTRDTTVLQALSLAGGPTVRGATNRVQISRVVEGKKQEIKVKLTDLVKPGDTIIVPQKFF